MLQNWHFLRFGDTLADGWLLVFEEHWLFSCFASWYSAASSSANWNKNFCLDIFSPDMFVYIKSMHLSRPNLEYWKIRLPAIVDILIWRYIFSSHLVNHVYTKFGHIYKILLCPVISWYFFQFQRTNALN